jgi:hypothetical protein
MTTTETTTPALPGWDEIWLPIVGHEGRYEVSDRGRVRAIFPARGYPPPPRFLKPALTGDGHLQIRLSNGRRGDQDTKLLHVLVLEAFRGRRPAGQGGRHLNGDPTNCRAGNLAWGTQAENVADAIRHGTHQRGEEHVNAKLTEEQVRQVPLLVAQGWRQRQIAARFGVSFQLISQIQQGKSWRHITQEAS